MTRKTQKKKKGSVNRTVGSSCYDGQLGFDSSEKENRGSGNRAVGSSSETKAVTKGSVLVARGTEEFIGLPPVIQAKDDGREVIFLNAKKIQLDKHVGDESDIEEISARHMLVSLNDASDEHQYGFSSSPAERTWADFRRRNLYAEIKDGSWILVDVSCQ